MASANMDCQDTTSNSTTDSSTSEYKPSDTEMGSESEKETDDIFEAVGKTRKRLFVASVLNAPVTVDSSTHQGDPAPSTSKRVALPPFNNDGEDAAERLSGLRTTIVPYSSTESEESEEEKTPMKEKRTRARLRHPTMWKTAIRKKKHQTGEAYVSKRGKRVPSKKIKDLGTCECIFKCSEKISNAEREALKTSYYTLTQNEKHHYLLKTTDRRKKQRHTQKIGTSRKNYSFQYSFEVNNTKVRVCKNFYLGTLVISQKPVYNAHQKKDPITGTPASDKRGKKPNSRVPQTQKQHVRDHINSFPRAESHYCRSDTKKEYLDPELNQVKMYDLYSTYCAENGYEPVKLSMYRHIFSTEFNLDFLLPKSDRCDLCEEYLMSEKETRLTAEVQNKYDIHVKEKKLMREERQKDRQSTNVVVCFDLENVIGLPRADVSSFFYKRKLNVYNMTAHVSTTKQCYCAFWTEAVIGRSGNDIASAVIRILEEILKDLPNVKELTLWSDSCVPQNRNSIISFGMTDFLARYPTVEKITMKYSTPGHSCIQEVDNIHSCIEKALKAKEVWSPMSFLRQLLKVNRRKPYRVLQLSQANFKDYQACAKYFQYSRVPFTQVTQLQFVSKAKQQVKYKKSHGDEDFSIVTVQKDQRSGRKQAPVCPVGISKVRLAAKSHELSAEKRNDLQAMLKWMPSIDTAYYASLGILPKNK